jgi:hypothetical protein
VQAQVLLADYAQESNGKLTVVGAGWTYTGPPPATAHAVAALVEVPWDQTNVRHTLRLELVDADGQPVMVPGVTGDVQPVVLENTLEVGRPPGSVPGMSITAPLAVQIMPGLPLLPGQRYTWRLVINDETREHWQQSFSVRPAAS